MRVLKTPQGVEIIEFNGKQDSDGSVLQEVRNAISNDIPRGTAPFAYTKHLPTILLYDDRGLELYDKITDLKEYFLFDAELDLLKEYSDDIADCMFGKQDQGRKEAPKKNHHNEDLEHPASLVRDDGKWGSKEVGTHNYGVNAKLQDSPASSSCLLVELGAGSLKKTSVLLRSLAKHCNENQSMTYYAVDLEHDQLVSTLDALLQMEDSSVTGSSSSDSGKVLIKGARASYDEFLPHMTSDESASKDSIEKGRKVLLWLGSSIGNFTRQEAADVLKRYVDEGLEVGDRFLIGIDSTKDADKIELAYGDPSKVTETFILNGLSHLERLCSEEGWKTDLAADKFEYVHRFNPEDGCHEAYVKPKCDIHISPGRGNDILLKAGELLLIERSFKYSAEEVIELLNKSGLRFIKQWQHSTHDYGLYLVEKPPIFFESTQVSLAQGLNPFGLPSLDDWRNLWKAFDCVTLDMIPQSMLHTKPIDLRHICLFYIGHIPTFLQIHLSRALDEDYTPPSKYTLIFERGIDPNMDDPTICHDHSIVPEKEEDWPTLAEILDYRDRVRQRLTDVYTSGRLTKINMEHRRLARAITMVYEHEAFHLETLLYMLLQKSDSINPPPGFGVPDWSALSKEWNASELANSQENRLTFDKTTLTIGIDDKDTEDLQVPYSSDHVFGWDNENGVRTIAVDAFQVSATPVVNKEYLAFLNQQGFPAHLIPSSWISLGSDEFGIRVVYRPGYVPFSVGQHWPTFASATQLSAFSQWKGGRLPTEPELRVFMQANPVDHPTANIGFKNWHPIPPSLGIIKDGKRVGNHNGGGWEWTSTDFDKYEGFSSSILYPGYSSDFFDGTHSVILAGSWASLPRLAGRPSCRNWYQKNYPYVFCTARVAYDL